MVAVLLRQSAEAHDKLSDVENTVALVQLYCVCRRGAVDADGVADPRVRAAARGGGGPLLAHPARGRVLQEGLPAARHRAHHGAAHGGVHHGGRGALTHGPTTPRYIYDYTHDARKRLMEMFLQQLDFRELWN